jgi:hypothetical protein
LRGCAKQRLAIFLVNPDEEIQVFRRSGLCVHAEGMAAHDTRTLKQGIQQGFRFVSGGHKKSWALAVLLGILAPILRWQGAKESA